MKTFLQETVISILEKKQDLKNVICVLPSERAGVNLKKELRFALKGKASFLPRIISIENFIKEISGLESIDQISLVFQFYQIYKQEFKEENPDNFERFMSWATIALQDFNEIDRHLVNPDKIFDYLTDIQNIKEWSLEEHEVTYEMTHYMGFIKDLDRYYKKLRNKLLDQKSAYQGLVYRKAHEKCVDYIDLHKDYSYHFIGFNALNKAEEGIFQAFLQKDNNYIYWDVDTYYYNVNHEAGTFFRSFFENWKCLENQDLETVISNHFEGKKNIQIVGAPLNVTGVKYSTSVLKKELDYNETAMVLAEESLLPVVLNSLPQNVDKVNITMGYALGNIPLTGFFKNFFEIFLNKDKLGKKGFYYQDLLSFFKHPYILKGTEHKSKHIVEVIQKNNFIFIGIDKLESLMKEQDLDSSLLSLFKIENISDLLHAIFLFLDQFQSKFTGVDILYFEKYKTIFNNIIKLNEEYQSIHSIRVLQKIFSRLLSLETIDFKGDALEGLQLMGVLETRCLDFKNIIITSVNEGVLPSGKKERSFISYEVKQHFNMPTHLAKDAIFSYHFYRLIQRAENIYLVYNTKTDDFGGGEMSRFLTRLSMDKESEVVQQNISIPVLTHEESSTEINKNIGVMEVLQAYFKKGISPSRITDYMNDPMSFYKNIVLKIREVQEVEEEVAFNTLGTIVHDSLELLYKPYIGKILVEADFKVMKSESEKMVLSKFKEYFKQGEIETGKNRLIKEVALQFVVNFLDSDLSLVRDKKELVILDVENEYNISLTTPQGHKVNLKGKIDRVDELDGVRRIVDYKTGKVVASDLKLADMSVVFTDYKYHKIVQVMTYVLLYTETQKFDVSTRSLQTGIYSFKNLKAGFLAMNFAEGRKPAICDIEESYIEEFKNNLLLLLDEILDNKINFIANPDNPYKIEA